MCPRETASTADPALSWQEFLKRHSLEHLLKRKPELQQAPWKPGEEDRQVAWVLYTELRTRITTQPLRYHQGDEAAALTSIFNLFEITRKVLKEQGPSARHMAIFSVLVLNGLIRPFTAYWHKKSERGDLQRQDVRRRFRRELLALRRHLGACLKVFGTVAEGDEFVAGSEASSFPPQRASFRAERIWPTDYAGPKIPEGKKMIAAELEAITKRWKGSTGGLGACEPSSGEEPEAMGTIGLALSGGGIRSATFCLGVLQSLARKMILPEVDYLSTVSGGGYLGSFWQHQVWTGEDISRVLGRPDSAPESSQVRWLRNNSKYLLSTRWRDRFCTVLRVVLGLLPGAFFVAGVMLFLWMILYGYSPLTLGVCAALLLLPLFAPVNLLSLHPLYRSRLAKAYLKSERGEYPKLSELSHEAPLHLINVTVNLPNSKNPELRGRRSDFFCFNRLAAGSVLTGYCKTASLESSDSRLDLATAMAISGAAAGSYMGRMTRSPLSSLMTLANIRLGYWLANPERARGDKRMRKPLNLLSYFRELSGLFDERSPYVNLSDGGHIENLGLYELLRRRCKLIVCVDGEADRRRRCGALIKASRYAAIDLGIEIDIDLDELLADQDGLSQSHFALGKIDYGREGIGYLIYIKSTLTGNEPHYVREYHSRHPAFPHQSTADQLFDEDQFEAYRALGEHAAGDLFSREILGEARIGDDRWKGCRSRCWLEALVREVLPPSPVSADRSRQSFASEGSKGIDAGGAAGGKVAGQGGD